MRRILLLLLLLCCSLGACAADAKVGVDPAANSPKRGVAVTAADYTGPSLRVVVEGSELVVTVTAGSGGHILDLRETRRVEGRTEIKLVPTTPAEGEVVSMAIVELEERIAWKDENGPVRVYVQERQRGAEYLVEPQYELAAVLNR